MSSIRDLHQKWMQEEDYRKVYAELQPEFELAQASLAASLTQEQSAQMTQTKQPGIERPGVANRNSQPKR